MWKMDFLSEQDKLYKSMTHAFSQITVIVKLLISNESSNIEIWYVMQKSDKPPGK